MIIYEIHCTVCGRRNPLMMNVVNSQGAYPVCSYGCSKHITGIIGNAFRNPHTHIFPNPYQNHKRLIRIEV